jgi:hypothetical protein
MHLDEILALARWFTTFEPVRDVLLPRTKLDDAGNASLGEVSPTVEESVLRTRHADLTPSDAFPAAQ